MAVFSGVAALAASAVGAISSFIGGITLAGIGTALLKGAVGVGLSYLASAIAGKSSDSTASFAVNGQLQSGGTVSRSIIFGMTATAGSLVYANTWGNAGKTPNAYVTQVIALADAPIKSVLVAVVNGVACEIDFDHPHAEYGWPVLEYRKGNTDYLWLKFYDGTQTEADSFLVGRVSSTDRPYEATRVGHGVAYVIATSRVNQELFSGFPSFKFVLDGMRLYDPSKDSSVGGNGAQRWSDASTWGGDGDRLPVVQLYALMRGIRWNGQWLYGLQTVTDRRLPASHWIAQIGKCRTEIEGADGLEATYRSGAEVQVSAAIQDAAQAILTACNGRLAEIGGTYKPFIGVSDEPVMTFTDADILSTEEQSFAPFFGLSDTINGITASYPSPDDSWNMTEATPLYNGDYEVEDGNRRLLSDVSLDFVPYAAQVQRLMQSALKEARRARRHTISMPPKFGALEPGDIVATSSNRNGYIEKRFRVDGVLDQPNLDVVLDITEVDPSDYSWNQGTDYKPPISGSVSSGVPAAQPMYGWKAEPATIFDANGNARRPSIKVICAPDQDDVANVWVQVRLKASQMVVFDSSATAYAAPYEWILNGTFLSASLYQARGRFVPYSNRTTEWGDWIDVLTPDVRFLAGADYDPYEGAVGLSGLDDDLASYQDWIGSGLRDVQTTLEELDARVAGLDLSAAYARQQMRQQIKVAADGVTAEWSLRADVLASADAAISSRVETLTASLATQSASFTSRADALAAADTALSSRVDTLTASLTDTKTGLQNTATAVSTLQASVATTNGNVTSVATALTSLTAASASGDVSTANFRMSAMGGPEGYARIGAEARQGGNGGWRSAAWYLDVPNDASLPSRFVVEAGQFLVVAGGNLNNPFVVDGAAVRMNVANIGTVTAGEIRSSNGKMVISLNAGTIVISS
ncbi:phage tail protein [Agrobacterium vitis]